MADDRKLALTLATQFWANRQSGANAGDVIYCADKFLEFLRADRPQVATDGETLTDDEVNVEGWIIRRLEQNGGSAGIKVIMERLRALGFYMGISSKDVLFKLGHLVRKSKELRRSGGPDDDSIVIELDPDLSSRDAGNKIVKPPENTG